MGFQQASEAKGPRGSMNLPGAKPRARHLPLRGSRAGARARHSPYTYTYQYKIYCYPPHKTPLFERKRVSVLYFAQAGLAPASPRANLSFPWSCSTAHPKPVVGWSRRRYSAFWVGGFRSPPLQSPAQSSLTISSLRCHAAAPCSQNMLP